MYNNALIFFSHGFVGMHFMCTRFCDRCSNVIWRLQWPPFGGAINTCSVCFLQRTSLSTVVRLFFFYTHRSFISRFKIKKFMWLSRTSSFSVNQNNFSAWRVLLRLCDSHSGSTSACLSVANLHHGSEWLSFSTLLFWFHPRGSAPMCVCAR